jgi:hypothetical protein
MGRHYDGDINGKFAFGSQSSDAADRFGVTGVSPPQLDYYFDEDDIPDIKKELKRIEKSFGEHELPLLAYFDLYVHEDLAEDVTKISFSEYLKTAELPDLSGQLWEEYNDYKLGRQILACVEKTGDCNFTADN